MIRPTSQRALPGFTLIEVLTASAIFVTVSIIAITAYLSIFAANRAANAERLLLDETAFVMERLVKDARNHYLDYPEYRRWTTAGGTVPDPGIVRDEYEVYMEQSPGGFLGLEAITGNEDLVSNSDCGVNPTAFPCLPGLVLISPEGDRRIRVRRVVLTDGDRAGEGVLRASEERLVDDNGDWHWIDANCETGVACNPVEHDLSSAAVDVVDFSFRLAPVRDPFFAYEDDDVQQQPMVTLRLHVRTSVTEPRGVGPAPEVDVSTTVSIRTYGPVVWTPTPL